MSARRFSRLQKATTLIPLAVLSVAWTANVTNLSSSPIAAASNGPSTAPPTLPDGTRLPSAPLRQPASVTAPRPSGQPAASTSARDAVSHVSATGIPSTALAAYQRAATVINASDKACHLDWTLVAAIGRLESNHGRFGGSHLTTTGLATPAIVGPALTGRKGNTRVTDTDGGQYDGDTRFDHAVGPMQFLPSTWAVVGVDADGDGKRDPEDVNDAALAAAVYLCSGSNLSTLAGQRQAVFRYNHSRSYVAAVLGVAAAYAAGDYTAVPDPTSTGPLIVSSTEPTDPPAEHGSTKHAKGSHLSDDGKTLGASSSLAGHARHPESSTRGPKTGTEPVSKQPQQPKQSQQSQQAQPSKPASPAPPVISSPSSGATLADNTPTISGTGMAGATVTLTVTAGGAEPVTATTTVDDAGTWSLTTTALPDGDYSVTATQTDAAGTSQPSAAITFTVDTSEPPTPTSSPESSSSTPSGEPSPTPTTEAPETDGTDPSSSHASPSASATGDASPSATPSPSK